ncbi:thioredoxin-dependent thiol peroxidase [Porphyromonas cangingivalis]|uniref:thioredoxin-dependent peroxiredoxin n=1 Tax=Porphyromonas cangingivalis TaxID=36874 RepID=A0A1T4JM97_PORCN|nr:thioredoxin-dependent thiol peroxidase [Porphyromonas cangingivalis]SJZ31292.1 peroxiredoxin Q/BCP [Porphyromonas cangingivalis]VEJ04397.1 Putative peroxiredoxin bcp [Porphyromonas cangingivalis]
MIKIGDKIPAILGKDQDGNEITAEGLKGNKVILYFYPKDNTSGCTAQACSLRDGIADLKAAGYIVIGVSKDSAKSHTKFRDQHSLPFALIADTDTELNQAFGVWVEKSMYGRKYMGTERTTFVIDEEGIVRAIVSGKEVDTKEHARQLLEMISKLDK